jgi:predicted Zn-dependent peptidase
VNIAQDLNHIGWGAYRKTVLRNGLRILTEQIPFVRSVSLGIWVRSGSRFEGPRINGICHFIEHMLFKGTPRRTAYAIAREIDSVGGGLNAFTSKEVTAFYCRVLDEDLALAVDLLTDIFLNPSFPEEEIEREKQVVVQEIRQVEDNPEDLVHETLGTTFWKDDPLGQPIMGTIANVNSFDRDAMLAFRQAAYTPAEIVLCAAGAVSHDHFVELTGPVMEQLQPGPSMFSPTAPRTDFSSHVITRDLEQVHICAAAAAPSAVDARRHPAYVLHTVLGGGVSSRLFQEVREKNGLAYSVYSFLSSFSDSGAFGVYAAADPERVEELIDILRKETAGLAGSVTEEEVRLAKKQIKGNVLLAMESSEARMNRLAKGEYYFGRYIPLEEILKSIEAVTLDEVRSLAEEILNAGPFATVVLGPVTGDDEFYSLGA